MLRFLITTQCTIWVHANSFSQISWYKFYYVYIQCILNLILWANCKFKSKAKFCSSVTHYFPRGKISKSINVLCRKQFWREQYTDWERFNSKKQFNLLLIWLQCRERKGEHDHKTFYSYYKLEISTIQSESVSNEN